ncbi:MAG: hypothetical protein U5J83_00030 [Bryobacterales bacterium]|nr:hypothetical protein [Bryobacterales bacterium]
MKAWVTSKTLRALLQLCVVDVDEGLEARLFITRGIAQRFAEAIVHLELKPVRVDTTEIDLEPMEAGIAIVLDHVESQRLWIRKEIYCSPRLAVRKDKRCQFAALPRLDASANRGVLQEAASTDLRE